MEKTFQIHPIGFVRNKNNAFIIELEKEYYPALTNIEGFSHLHVIWWAHLFEETKYPVSLITEKPYKRGPGKLGLFATRTPLRPNPLLISIISVQKIDHKKGLIHTPFIDAEDGSPVLDIKPYHLSERVKECRVPGWCAHWPLWYEDSSTFDWKDELSF